jgi:hypothetical protein
MFISFLFFGLFKNNTNEVKPPDGKSETTVTGKYKLTFNATWSSSTHPNDFPSNPHFSGLIGMTHNADIKLFEVDKKATDGIKNMAETGGKSPLSDEIDQLITEKKQNLELAEESLDAHQEALKSNLL